jgi:hypothetical protein
MLTACYGDNDAGSSADFQMTLSGSVGDGPIVDADVFVSDADGAFLARATSTSTANYQVAVPSTATLPLRVTAVGGMDLVTGRANSFPLIAVVVNPDQTTVNMSPFSTMAVALAERAPGGITEQNLAAARDVMAGAFSMGLDPTIDPMYDAITESNVAAVVLANEALGEALRRTHAALRGTDAQVTAEELVGLIADDLVDGAIDASTIDPRVAVTFHAARAAVLLESAAGALHVDGADATTLMNTSIGDILPDAADPPSVTSVEVPDGLINEARTSLAVLTQLVDAPMLEDLLQQLDQTTAGDLREMLATELTPQLMVDLADSPMQASLADDAALAEAAAIAEDPSATPPPTVSFAADPDSVVTGGTARLSWASANADFCRASGDWSGEQPLEGAFLTAPLDTPASYTLTCTGAGGTTSAQVNVLVDGAPPADPPTVSLVANSTTVNAGDPASLTWTTTDAEACEASGNWSGSKPPNGTESTQPLATDSTFVLTCTGPGGSDAGTVVVSVNAPPPAPTLTLNASPLSIQAGEATTLSWNARDASSCAASGNWSGPRPTNGTELTGPLSADSTYTLTCTGPGGTVSRTTSIDVQPPPAPGVSFTASATTLTSGDSVTLSWSSSNATTCAAAGGWNGDKGLAGSETIGPLTSDTAFTLSCSGPGGSSSQTVNVVVDVPSAPGVSFTAASLSLDYAGSTVLSWSADNADSCSANGDWAGQKTTSGSQSVGPLTSTASYGLTCSGPGGSTSETVTIEVGAPPAPTLTFTAGQTRINSGETVGLSWASQNTESCSASGSWSGVRATTDSETVGPLNSDATFNLTCSGVGGSISRSVSIDVVEIPPPTIAFSTSTPNIQEGASAELSWTATTANSCTASGGWSGSKATSGNESSGPLAQDTTFTLACTGTGGTSSESLTVTVAPAPAPSLALDALPQDIRQGESTTLTWSSANANSCTASGAWTGNKAISGSDTIGPLASNASFSLTCTGVGGSVTEAVNVTVAAIPAPTVTLGATPTNVTAGETVSLNWSTTDADDCTASGDWSGAKATTGSETLGPLSSDASFTLTCTGVGGTASNTASVSVTPPPPTVNLDATPISVEYAGVSQLSWSASNADSCTASGDWTGQKAVSGNETTTTLTSDATFTLTCTGSGGSAIDSATVGVAAPPAPTLSLSAAQSSVVEGESTTLNWSATNADNCTAQDAWSGDKPTSGSEQVGPLASNATFTLSCSGAGGLVTQSANVTVTPPPEPTVSLSANSGSVDDGGSVTLDWSSEGVDTCTASGAWTGAKSTNGSESVGPINADTTFSLNCSGSAGSAVAMTTVQVRSARLSWDAPTENVDGTTLTDLDGFVVYYGSTSRNYTQTVDINDPDQTELQLDLTPGDWFFAVTAKDADGNESAFSGEVSKTISN